MTLMADATRGGESRSAFGNYIAAHRTLLDDDGLGVSAFDRLAAQRDRITVEPRHMPLMVRFDDMNDFRSVQRVDPSNLATSFGPGVALGCATVEMTTAPITTGIEKLMPPTGGKNVQDWLISQTASDPWFHFGPQALSRGLHDE